MKREEAWEKIEDWFDLYGLNHCYVRISVDGKLEHIQAGERNYCQGGHYLSSGPYNWNGTKKARRAYDENNKRWVLLCDGRELRRFSSFLAIFLFRTKFEYSHKKSRYAELWDGSLPELWFHRSRASKTLYEKKRRYFIESPYVPQEEADKLHIPPEFLKEATVLFELLKAFLTTLSIS